MKATETVKRTTQAGPEPARASNSAPGQTYLHQQREVPRNNLATHSHGLVTSEGKVVASDRDDFPVILVRIAAVIADG